MADTQHHTTEPQGPPMHHRDWSLLIILGIPAALAITIFSVGLGAFVTGSIKWGFSLCIPSLLALIVMAVLLFKARSTPRPSLQPRPYLFIALTAMTLLTWAFFGWQTWMWFHPARAPDQGYTKTQLDEYAVKEVFKATKLAQDKLDKANKEIEALHKSIAQSDIPVSVDKLPTSLKVLFKGNEIQEIESKNVIWTKDIAWHEEFTYGLFPRSIPSPIWVVVIIFKKPILFKDIHVNDNANIPAEVASKSPRYALIEFDANIATFNSQNIVAEITFTK